MKCSYSVSDLYTILSEIPKMTEEDYNVFDDDNLCGKTVEVVFHLPTCTDRKLDIKRLMVEAMLTDRRYFYHVSGKLFFCFKTGKNNTSEYPNFDGFSIVHVHNESNIDMYEKQACSCVYTNFKCLITTRNCLYTAIMKKL